MNTDISPQTSLRVILSEAGAGSVLGGPAAWRTPSAGGRELSGIYGKHGKYGIRKSLISLPLRFSDHRLPEWGSGGRWFESSRPDI